MRTNESIRKTVRPSETRPNLKNRPIVAAIEKSGRAQGSNLKMEEYNKSRDEARSSSLFLPFPCGEKKATTLQDQWVNNKVIQLPKVD